MSLILKNITVGDCFRFVNNKDQGDIPYYADTKRNTRKPDDLPGLWDATNVDDRDEEATWWDTWGNCEVEILEHYRRAPQGRILTRKDIQVGECYMFIGEQTRYVMITETQHTKTLPRGWNFGNIAATSRSHQRVRRVPHWDFAGNWCGLPGNDGLTKQRLTPLQLLSAQECDGLTGEMCLQRLEYAMQNESLARPMGSAGMVSTLGSWGLTEPQVALGRLVWGAKLAELQMQAYTEAKSREVSIVVDMDYE